MRSSAHLAASVEELRSLIGDDDDVERPRTEPLTDLARLSEQLTAYNGD